MISSWGHLPPNSNPSLFIPFMRSLENNFGVLGRKKYAQVVVWQSWPIFLTLYTSPFFLSKKIPEFFQSGTKGSKYVVQVNYVFLVANVWYLLDHMFCINRNQSLLQYISLPPRTIKLIHKRGIQIEQRNHALNKTNMSDLQKKQNEYGCFDPMEFCEVK